MTFTSFLHGLGLPFAGADHDLSQVQVAKPSRKSPSFCSRRRKLRLLCRHKATPGAAGWTRAGRKAARRLWQTALTRDEYDAGMARLREIETWLRPAGVRNARKLLATSHPRMRHAYRYMLRWRVINHDCAMAARRQEAGT